MTFSFTTLREWGMDEYKAKNTIHKLDKLGVPNQRMRVDIPFYSMRGKRKATMLLFVKTYTVEEAIPILQHHLKTTTHRRANMKRWQGLIRLLKRKLTKCSEVYSEK